MSSFASAQTMPSFPWPGTTSDEPAKEGSAGTDAAGSLPAPPASVLAPEPMAPGGTAASEDGQLRLEAILTADGEPLGEDLVWRIYRAHEASNASPTLVEKLTEPRPELRLPPGTYFVNAAYGRANLTRQLTVFANGKATERFVLNAGGLRATVEIAGGQPPNPQSVSIDVFSDDSDQTGERRRVVSGIRPGTVVRLNSGIYYIQSKIGRSNAVVRAEVSVEAGKLSEVTITHEAAMVSFKLVAAPGGEAIAGTRWTVLADNGNVVQESMGALPSHVLAPGQYTVVAQAAGQSFRRTFEVASGPPLSVEVISSPSN